MPSGESEDQIYNDAVIKVRDSDDSPRGRLFRTYNESVTQGYLLPPASRLVDSADYDRLALITKITEGGIDPLIHTASSAPT